MGMFGTIRFTSEGAKAKFLADARAALDGRGAHWRSDGSAAPGAYGGVAAAGELAAGDLLEELAGRRNSTGRFRWSHLGSAHSLVDFLEAEGFRVRRVYTAGGCVRRTFVAAPNGGGR